MPPPFGCRQSVDKRSTQRYGTGNNKTKYKYYIKANEIFIVVKNKQT